ncbi:hypothetical protein AGDE_11052 [Angomonas deanei]|nr:hypothetical protein AGDE_11052 [Angomonas deanei]|eukprot:EPY26867.1 hypothetical protein AGDE_11052 [Angomonas deanei]
MQIALFHQHYKVRYVPKGLTAWIFYILCLLIVIVLPFVIGLAMQNFWIENNYFYHKPEITFTGRAAVRVSTVLRKEYLWTTSTDFNTQFVEGTSMEILPLFSVTRNGDDFEFLITVPINDLGSPLYSEEYVYTTGIPANQVLDSIKEASFLPEFIYTIHSQKIKLNMTAAPLLLFERTPNTYSTRIDNTTVSYSSGPTCAVTEADLQFHSTNRLINSPYVHYTNTYTDSPFLQKAKQAADLYDLPYFAQYYTSRNQSLVTRTRLQSAGGLELLEQPDRDLDLLNSFTWRVKLRATPAVVQYVPSYREVLKWGWIQYFIIAYVIQWVMWKIRGFIVVLGLLDVSAIYHARKI